LLLLLLLWL